MNIQLFAGFDEIIDTYNNEITKSKNEMANLETEKQNILNEYNTNYNNQLNEYNNLQEQQQNYIDTWATTQKETQQKQTDYNINLINQNKAEAQKQTDAELGDAYIDYQKGMNQYGGNAEQMAANGLAGTGFAKNTDIAMNVTYQNRVSTAKAALTKANTDYDNQIQQALLNNDAALAEVALQQMQQSYQLALSGFEYKTNLYNNKVTYEQNINDTYFNRNQTLQSRIDTYNSALAGIEQTQQELAAEQAQREQEYQQWLKEYEEKQRQFNEQLAEDRRQYNASLAEEQRQYNKTYNATYSGNSGNNSGFTDTSEDNTQYALVTQYWKGDYNSDALTNGKVDKNKVFSNGYQPNNYNGTKLKSSGYTVSQVFGTGNTGSTGANIDNQTIWKAGNKYLIWDGSQNKYIDVTSKMSKKSGGKGASGGGGGAGGFR